MMVLRKPQYWESLQTIEDYIAYDNPSAAIDLWLCMDNQVSRLADPNFRHRRGRLAGALELVAHPNYVDILE
jgi:toxin ParE1/3/4